MKRRKSLVRRVRLLRLKLIELLLIRLIRKPSELSTR